MSETGCRRQPFFLLTVYGRGRAAHGSPDNRQYLGAKKVKISSGCRRAAQAREATLTGMVHIGLRQSWLEIWCCGFGGVNTLVERRPALAQDLFAPHGHVVVELVDAARNAQQKLVGQFPVAAARSCASNVIRVAEPGFRPAPGRFPPCGMIR
jgi:hypothetical protein